MCAYIEGTGSLSLQRDWLTVITEGTGSLVDSMATIAPDYGEPVGLCMLLDLTAHVPVPLTGLHWEVNTNNGNEM